MPRVQRSLSIKDLRHRFKREQDGSQGENPPEAPPALQDSPRLPPEAESPPTPPSSPLPFHREQDSSQGEDSPGLPPGPRKMSRVPFPEIRKSYGPQGRLRQERHREQDGSQGQDSPPSPPPPLSSSQQPLPRDFEALRVHHGYRFGYSRSMSPPL